jgi:Zn-dependent hydrolases, including glyoxylases
MKLLIVLFCACLIPAGVLFAQQPKLRITPLHGDFYVYTTWRPVGGALFPSNSLYVVTAKGIVMIDTPWDTTQLQPLLDSMQARHHQQPVMSLSTHFHADRTAGLNWLQAHGVATWSSAYTKQLCIEKNEEKAAHIFTKDTSFTVGNHSFQAYYPGPGHTKDNIVVWFEKEKILYGGCFVKSTESEHLGNLSDADTSAWPASIRKVLKQFKPNYVIPGHQDWKDKRSLEHTLKLLEK